MSIPKLVLVLVASVHHQYQVISCMHASSKPNLYLDDCNWKIKPMLRNYNYMLTNKIQTWVFSSEYLTAVTYYYMPTYCTCITSIHVPPFKNQVLCEYCTLV